jgi:hypothetical protein
LRSFSRFNATSVQYWANRKDPKSGVGEIQGVGKKGGLHAVMRWHRQASVQDGPAASLLHQTPSTLPSLAHQAAIPVTEDQIQQYSQLLGDCLQHAMDLGIDIAINVGAGTTRMQGGRLLGSTAGVHAPALEPLRKHAALAQPPRLLLKVHADDGRADNGWRNTLAFDPLEPFSGFSFYDAVLAPITDALARVLHSNSTAWLSLQVGWTGSRECGGCNLAAGLCLPQAKLKQQCRPHRGLSISRAGRDGRHRVLLPLAVGGGCEPGEGPAVGGRLLCGGLLRHRQRLLARRSCWGSKARHLAALH